MAKRRRLAGAGTTHHVMARSNDGSIVFTDDQDRRAFLDCIARVGVRHRWSCLAYCLMGNHFHLALTTVQDSLSAGMRDALAPYARGFNRRHGRVGRVFRERFLSIPVTSDEQLMVVLRYIALNPVRAGLVSTAADWEWSSARPMLGVTPAPQFLEVERALAVFGPDPVTAFASFVRGGEDVGTETPRSLMARAPTATIPTIDEVLRAEGGPHGIEACISLGYSQVEVARALGISPSAVCQRLRRAGTRRHR